MWHLSHASRKNIRDSKIRFGWPNLLLVCLLILLGVLVSSVHDGLRYRQLPPAFPAVMDEMTSSGNFWSAEAIQQYRSREIEKMRMVFSTDTPIAGIYGYCRSQNCYRPGRDAFEKMRIWGARASLFDSDVCRYLSGSPSLRVPFGIEPVLAPDPARQDSCKIVNIREVRAGTLWFNRMLFAASILLFTVGAVLLVWLTRRRTKSTGRLGMGKQRA